MDTFYRSLNFATKPIVDTVSGESFMELTYLKATSILVWVTKTNTAYHTRDSEVSSNSYTGGMSTKQQINRDQDIANMKMQIDVLIKHMIGAILAKVNVVGS